jgi:hypothetical protein
MDYRQCGKVLLRLLKTRAEGNQSARSEPLDYVIPAWSAGIQVDMDVSGGVLANLDAGGP